MDDLDEDLGSEIMGGDDEGVEQVSATAGEGLIRSFVSRVISEEIESTYNDYEASQDQILKRLRPIEREEVARRFPKFYSAVESQSAANETDVRDSKWLLMRRDFMTHVPHVILPDGDIRIYYWDQALSRLVPTDNDDLEHALFRFATGSEFTV